MEKYITQGNRQYITGSGRGNSDYDLLDETHLYEGDFGEPGRPLCDRGWNRDWGTAYSIFRGCVGDLGVCSVCKKRAEQGLAGVDANRISEDEDVDTMPYYPLKPGLPLYPFDDMTPNQIAVHVITGQIFEEDIPAHLHGAVNSALAELVSEV